MRRVIITAIAVGAALMASTFPAMAAPTPSPPVPGKKVCTITDKRLTEISGLVATTTGYVAVNAAVADQDPTHQRIFRLDSACKVLPEVGTYAGSPSDPQDIVRAKDGSFWIADIGDPSRSRKTIGLWKAPADLSTSAKLYHVSYPDGAHNAKALLLNGDGTPIIVTFEADQTARLYVPAGALSATATVPLKLAAKIALLSTLSPNVLGGAGRKSVVGGAVSPDGSKVALRTYADAFEWDVTGGDVIAAVQKQPRVTGLSGEPYNESLTYSADGKLFVSASMTNNVKRYDSGVKGSTLLSWAPSVSAYVAPKTMSPASGGQSGLLKWFAGLSLSQTYLLFAAVTVFGLLLTFIGITGIVKGRKRAKKGTAKRPRDDDHGYDDGYDHRGDNAATVVLTTVPSYELPQQRGYPEQGRYPAQGDYADQGYGNQGPRG